MAFATYIQVAAALGSGLTALKLRSNGLSGRYRLFFFYMIFRACYVLLMTALDQKSDAYFWAYVCSQPIAWVLYVAVVLELFRLVLERHRGFYTVGRWAMWAGLAFSLTVSAATLFPKIRSVNPQRSVWAMGAILATERGLDFALAIFLVLMLLLLNVYTVPLSRNVLLHVVIYAAFFLSGALGAILRTFYGKMYLETTDAIALACSCACVLAWYFLLSPKGEEIRVRLPWFGAEQEERILMQLDSINAALLRVARK